MAYFYIQSISSNDFYYNVSKQVYILQANSVNKVSDLYVSVNMLLDAFGDNIYLIENPTEARIAGAYTSLQAFTLASIDEIANDVANIKSNTTEVHLNDTDISDGVKSAIGTPTDTVNTDSASTTSTLFGWIKGIWVSLFGLQPKKYTAINVTSANYTDAAGFLIYIPESFTGNIVATPFGNNTAVTFTSYTTGDYLRGGSVFKAVTTDTVTKTGLEAWR